MSARTVTTIPATISQFTSAPISEFGKRRVAGYARVSTDTDEQETFLLRSTNIKKINHNCISFNPAER